MLIAIIERARSAEVIRRRSECVELFSRPADICAKNDASTGQAHQWLPLCWRSKAGDGMAERDVGSELHPLGDMTQRHSWVRASIRVVRVLITDAFTRPD